MYIPNDYIFILQRKSIELYLKCCCFPNDHFDYSLLNVYKWKLCIGSIYTVTHATVISVIKLWKKLCVIQTGNIYIYIYITIAVCMPRVCMHLQWTYCINRLCDITYVHMWVHALLYRCYIHNNMPEKGYDYIQSDIS